MPKRVQSPSSIKCYKQCPRKYYYAYIAKLPQPPNVHQVRGNIAHDVLEHFFDIDTRVISLDSYPAHLQLVIQDLLLKEWQAAKPELEKLNLTKEQEIFYFEETLMMLLNWLKQFTVKIASETGSFAERFKKLTPLREQLYKSDNLHAQGIIDAIECDGETVRLMDYKTSSNQDINDHLLQLAIYSLLYYEKHGRVPEYAGIYFLKGKEVVVEVDEQLIEMAKKEIENIHQRTQSTHLLDYPRCPGPLCKWSTGQCEFYDTCKPSQPHPEETEQKELVETQTFLK
jgi:CRISPR/Cas system-associated exonuclease Cas4 (RecB family)